MDSRWHLLVPGWLRGLPADIAAVVAIVAVLLSLIIATAKQINQHAQAIWTVGKQIAGNTVAIWMLEETNRELVQIRAQVRTAAESAESMRRQIALLAVAAKDEE